MILDLFKYYAQFPDIKGVESIFANGRSDSQLYTELLNSISTMPVHSRIPGIQNYVFGQSYDAVKHRIDNISGTYLFLDFGEFSSTRDQRNTIHDSFDLATTIASKVSSNSDLVELAIVSEQTLQLAHQLRVLQYEDQKQHPWLKEIANQHTIIPFVAREFSSIGWTITYKREGADILHLKEALRNIHL